MKPRYQRVLMLALALATTRAWSVTVEDWSVVNTENTGVFQDSNGSNIWYSVEGGSAIGQKALNMNCNMVSNGYCGIWRTIGDTDLSSASGVRFMAKASVPTTIVFCLTDAHKNQYKTNATIPSRGWSSVFVPFKSLEKDQYYQPPGADPSKPLDLSRVSGMMFQPLDSGKNKICLGVITTVDGDVDISNAPKEKIVDGIDSTAFKSEESRKPKYQELVSAWFEKRFVLSWDDAMLLKSYNDARQSYISIGPMHKAAYEEWNRKCLEANEKETTFLKSVPHNTADCPDSFADLKEASGMVWEGYSLMVDDVEGAPCADLGTSREAVLLSMMLANRLVMNLVKQAGGGSQKYSLNLRDVKKALKAGDYKTAKKYLSKPFGEYHPIVGGPCGRKYVEMIMQNN